MKRFFASIILFFLLFSNLGVFFGSARADEGLQFSGEQREIFSFEENNLPKNETQSPSEQQTALSIPEISEEIIENIDEVENLESSQTEVWENLEFIEVSDSLQEIPQENPTQEDQNQSEISEIQEETSGEDTVSLESENGETGQDEYSNDLPGETEELSQEENLENSQVTEEESLLFVPYISISFQQPSYLIFSTDDTQFGEIKSDTIPKEVIYVCDELKPECKVNFDFRSSFTSEFPEKDFICESDFGLSELTGQENKCNPNTILFPEGKFEGYLKIIKKGDITKFRELKIIVKNRFSESGDTGKQDSQNSQEGSEDTGNIGGEIAQEELGENQDGSEYENNNFGEEVSGTESQIENENQGETEELNIGSEGVVLPEIIYQFQNWTYLETAGEDSFICDSSKEFCRTNYNFEASFTGVFQQKDYVCQIDFGLSELTGEEEKCNPTGIIYPQGSFETKVRIILKNNPELFTEKIISVQNISKIVSPKNEDTIESSVENQNTTQSGSFSTQTGSPQDEFESLLGGKNLEILYELQRPSYAIISPEKDDIFTCDRTKPECKINFDFEKSFSEDFPKKDYSCQIDFGFGVLTGEEEKCNPNTVVFPLGVHELNIIFSLRNNPEIFFQKIFFIKNDGYQVPIKSAGTSSTSTSASSSIKTQKRINLSLNHTSIIVQSGLEPMDKVGKSYRCLKNDCKVNLDYKTLHSKERCLWNFGSGVQSHSETHTRCNPGYVTFPKGIHKVSLTVYEYKYNDNTRTLTFEIQNLGEENIIKNTQDLVLQKSDIEKLGNEEISLFIDYISIILQGKISKEKIYQQGEPFLRCEGVEKCFVNFLGDIGSGEKNMTFSWKLDGEVFSEKLNPKGIWIEKGDHEIIFEIYQGDILLGSSHFQVEVYPKLIQAKASQEVGEGEKNIFLSQKSIDEPQLFSGYFYDGIVIHDFLANPLGSDIKEYIELKNTSSEPRDLFGCYLVGNSQRKFRFGEGQSLQAGEQKKFFQAQTKLTLGNKNGKISLFCDDALHDEIVWSKKVREGITYLGTSVGVYTSEYLKSLLTEEVYNIYIQKSFQFSARALKYDGLKLSGETLPGSRVEGYLGDIKLYDILVGENGKYEFTTKNIGAGKYEIAHFVTDIFGNRYEMKVRSFILKSESRTYWFRSKPAKAQKLQKIPQLLIQNNIAGITSESLSLSYRQKGNIFLLSVFIILFSLFAFFHLFFLLFPKDARKDIIVFQTRTRFQFVMILGE